MRFRYLLALLGLGLLGLGASAGGWAWLVAWLGVDFTALGVAYALGCHRIFGKDGAGRLPVWSRLVFAPLLTYAWLVWHVLRRLEREPPYSEVNPGLVIGRRLMPREFPGGYDNVLDLTAEFSEPAGVRSAPGYFCFPLLDGSAPMVDSLSQAVARLRPGRTFIHCAQGHGRSALLGAAVLLHNGAAATAEEAIRRLQEVRPGVRLNRAQRECVQAFAARAGARSTRA